MRLRTCGLLLSALSAPLGAAGGQDSSTVHREYGESSLRLHGFVDFNGSASTARGTPVSFGLGQFALYMTSQLSKTMSFLGETVFEYDDGFVVDVERVILSYSPKSYFRVGVGKHHTPIGYWNNAYHHGVALQPTISRPQMFLFEDEGGLLPVHTTGVLVSGRGISRFNLGYDLLAGNGIGSTPSADNDNHKSITGAVHSQVTSALRVGASAYTDRITTGTPDRGGTALREDVDERLTGGYVSYQGTPLEVFAEYQRAQQHGRTTGVASGADLYYAYAGLRVQQVTPYLRYDEQRVQAGNPYFGSGTFRQLLVGARYDVAALVVVKGELARRNTPATARATLLTLQLAVGF